MTKVIGIVMNDISISQAKACVEVLRGMPYPSSLVLIQRVPWLPACFYQLPEVLRQDVFTMQTAERQLHAQSTHLKWPVACQLWRGSWQGLFDTYQEVDRLLVAQPIWETLSFRLQSQFVGKLCPVDMWLSIHADAIKKTCEQRFCFPSTSIEENSKRVGAFWPSMDLPLSSPPLVESDTTNIPSTPPRGRF